MFSRGIAQLMAALPEFDGVGSDEVRRLLTGAYLDLLAARDLHGSDDEPSLDDLRRLATALELHVVLAPDLDPDMTKACAFVAAEAAGILAEQAHRGSGPTPYVAGRMPVDKYSAVEAGCLYLIAGFDANAAVASRALSSPSRVKGPDARACERALVSIQRFLELRAPGDQEVPPAPQSYRPSERVRWIAWCRVTELLDGHLRWLREVDDTPASGAGSLSALSEQLTTPYTPQGQYAEYDDLALLSDLLGRACAATEERALRSVPEPEEGDAWADYVERRVRHRPLLWPAALDFVSRILKEPTAHAVISVPTGAGKASVAELAIARGLTQGWVLYLAPTNALVTQILRDLRSAFDGVGGVDVRAFIGGGEYTELSGEVMQGASEGQIFVMTPEKCALALRQDPTAFEGLQVLVFDECHLISETGSRGVTSELVLAEVLHRAPGVRTLLMSAMVANTDELAAWIRGATQAPVVEIEDPWRPTRTVRGILGIDPARSEAPYRAAVDELESRGKRKNWEFRAPVNLMASLLGPWEGANTDNYKVLRTGFDFALTASKRDDGSIHALPTGYVNVAAAELTHQLATNGHRVLTFLPANRHHCFSVARDLAPIEPRPVRAARPEVTDALLRIADSELGAPSPLGEMFERGVGVHTSAMLLEEQRASEVAFVDGQAVAMFATGTLAQGLNLPATAVVIGGTRIGYDETATPEEREQRQKTQLLNAVGRAGRAYVAQRSMAVIIPDRWITVVGDKSPAAVRDSAGFLEFEDASTVIQSQVEGLLAQDFDELSAVEGLTSEEQTAFSFLALGDETSNRETLGRSFGAFRAGVTGDAVDRTAEGLRDLASGFIENAEVPAWVGEAAHVAGLPLPVMFAVHRYGRDGFDGIESVADCRDLLFKVLDGMSAAQRRLSLSEQAFRGTPIEHIFEADSHENGLAIFRSTLEGWMHGAPYIELARILMESDDEPAAVRGSGQPLPRAIRVIESGIRYSTSLLAGGLAALASVGAERGGEDWQLESHQKLAIDTIPLAIRLGTKDLPTTAWARWGFRHRVLASILASRLPPPQDLGPDALPGWVGDQRQRLVKDPESLPDGTEGDVELLRAAVIARRVL